LIIEGKNIQDWLQDRYIAAFCHCYRRLKDCTAIAGWGVMNEPHYGFIGYHDLGQAENPIMPMGPRPSPWDTICSASGHTVKVPACNSSGRKGPKRKLFNPGGHSLFKDGFDCPWKQAGVWTDEGGKPRLLRADHFTRFEGRPANFMRDFHKPFTLRFIAAMEESHENTFFFIEGMPPNTNASAHPTWEKDDPPNTINAFHWYDGFALFSKQFRPWFTMNIETLRPILGKEKIQSYFSECLAKGVQWASNHMGGMPCLLGEFGLAFDMNNRRAFAHGDYSAHEEALSMYYNAVDSNLLHSTIWNYTADNTNATGDGWNDEDLSIFSGGKERAVAGWKRPYPMATAGQPLAIKWNHQRGIFRYRFNADSAIDAPSIIYLPAEQFGPGTKIRSIPTGIPLRFEHQPNEQRLMVYNDGFGGEVEVVVSG
jgi:hypothetical protein